MSIPLKNLPKCDRPRERMLQHGAESVATVELIAIVLGSGVKGKSVLLLANEILSHFGSLEALASATIAEICQIKGVGVAKAIQLISSIHLGRRLGNIVEERPLVNSSKLAYSLVRDRLEKEKREVLICLMLDTKHRLIHQEVISIGTLSLTLVHPREVFYPAIRHKAASVVLAHNHPSGDCTPSLEDIRITEILVEAGRLISIPVEDHIVVGHAKFSSICSKGDKRVA